MKSIFVSDILSYLDKNEFKYKFVGNPNNTIEGFSSVTNYKGNTITWIKDNEKYKAIKDMINIDIKLIVISRDNELFDRFLNMIITDDPKNIFFGILQYFYEEKTEYGIGKNSVISQNAIIHPNINIGNNCVIEDNVEIGEGTIVNHNVVIKRNTKIGRNCLIQSGVIIGESGFGLRNENGVYVREPHFGGVEIGDRVEIGANTCVVRGTIDNTIISDGVKIDNLCHIAHNVFIGKGSIVVASTMIGGSTRIGENCYVSTSTIKNQVHINDNAFIGMGSLVIKDVKKGMLVYGAPAQEKRENKEKV